MAIKLEKVIPIGRRLVEYLGMFDLSEEDVKSKSIIDCGGGPSSFNFEVTAIGGNITSIDPIYQFSPDQIMGRVNVTFDPMFDQVRKNQAMFTWNHIKDVDELIEYRRSAINMFVDDFDKGKDQKRYVFEELPSLSFDRKSYDMALCSHLLFLYSEHLSLHFICLV